MENWKLQYKQEITTPTPTYQIIWKNIAMNLYQHALLQKMLNDPVKSIIEPGFQPGLKLGESYVKIVIEPGFYI